MDLFIGTKVTVCKIDFAMCVSVGGGKSRGGRKVGVVEVGWGGEVAVELKAYLQRRARVLNLYTINAQLLQFKPTFIYFWYTVILNYPSLFAPKWHLFRAQINMINLLQSSQAFSLSCTACYLPIPSFTSVARAYWKKYCITQNIMLNAMKYQNT